MATRRSATRREIANAYYNASFQYAVAPRTVGPTMPTTDPEGKGLTYLQKARDIYHRIGDRRGEANALWGLGNYLYFRRAKGFGIEENRQALEIFREVGDRTMEGWALHMLGTGLLRYRQHGRGQGRMSSTPSATSMPPATPPG